MKSKFRISALATLVLTVFACASANRRPGPPATQLAEVANDDVVATFFDDDFSKTTGGYSYSYGGNTHTKIARSSSNDGGSMLVTYLADDYSGVNVSMGTGKLLELSPYRK